MANGILVNTASSGQQSQAFNFSLTFTPEAWQQFWRCLLIGCAMSDHLMNTSNADLAITWNALSREMASLLAEGKIEYLRSETLSSR